MTSQAMSLARINSGWTIPAKIVFIFGNDLQMIRVDAAWNPTQVVDLHSDRNWASEQLIRNAVSVF